MKLKDLTPWTQITAKSVAVKGGHLAHESLGDSWLVVKIPPTFYSDIGFYFPSTKVGGNALINLASDTPYQPGSWWTSPDLDVYDVEEKNLSLLSKKIILELAIT